jgi:hypothetical protein
VAISPTQSATAMQGLAAVQLGAIPKAITPV